MSRPGPELAALATLHGVHTSYTDANGVTKWVADDVLVDLLQALDVPVRVPAEAAAALRDERRVALERPLEPVVVQWLAGPEPIRVTLPAGTDPRGVWVSLELEGGSACRDSLGQVAAPTGKAAAVEGAPHLRYGVDLGALLGRPLPPGYHRMTLEGVGPPVTALVLAAPTCPSPPRSWATFLPLHAVRSHDDWGTGSYTDLGRLGHWARAHGAAMVGTLPLYPAFLDVEPPDPSPYLPVSRLAYNEFFVDPTHLPELAATPEAQDLLDSDYFRARLSALHDARLVEYEATARLKRQVLEPMARSVLSGQLPGRLQQLHEFAQGHPELVAYARFRAAREGTAAGEAFTGVTGYHLYGQWAAQQQLSAAAAPAGLYADLPIGSHPDGFDPCWSPSSFMSDVQGGAPPDRFFSEGQAWGFRPLHPRRMREDGYRYLVAVLDRAFRHADCLRIDHVMGLQRLYMIPSGRTALEGTYVSYPADELHALVCIAADRSGATVVGEDLGTVPDSVRRHMARDAMMRTWVFQFESTAADPLPDPPPDCLAALGTHDLAPFAAFLWGDDITERDRAGALSGDALNLAYAERDEWRAALFGKLGLDAHDGAPDLTFEALEGCLAHLARSAADLVLVDFEDVWGEREAQNHPGTGPQAGNWRRRATGSIDDLDDDPAVVAVATILDRSGAAA